MHARAMPALMVVVLVVTGCAPDQGGFRGFWSRLETNISIGRQSGPLTLDWEVEVSASQRSRITGYVYNATNYRIGRVYLEIDALDARDQLIAQRYWWVMGDVPANNRAYFETPDLPAADRYRVSVYSYVIEPERGPF